MKQHYFTQKCLLALVGMILYLPSFAGGGWATSVVNITKDNEAAYKYKLNDEGWTDGDWGGNNLFQGTNFGTPATLILNGGAGNAWTDDSPGYTASSFKIFYRVYPSASTPGTWNSLDLDFLAYSAGNNKIWDKTNANIDLLALANNQPGNYTIEVVMSKDQFYTGGNWNSMIPGGQGTAYNAATSGFTATFDIVATGISQKISKPVFTIRNHLLTVETDKTSQLEIYTPTAKNVISTQTNGLFTKFLENGVYLVRLNGYIQKIVIH